MFSSPGQDNPLAELQLRDYLAIGRRRKWWIIFAWAAVLITTTVAVLHLPNVYHSETTILVDPQQVPSTYVASTVATSVMDRLSTIRQEILSPTRLKLLVDRLGLYGELVSQGKEQEIVAKLQKSITVDVVDAGGQKLSAFRIGYSGREAAETARVANELAATVITENLKARQQQFLGTADFLDNELQDTKKQLETKEADLGRMKATFIMDLPESKQFHLEALSNLRNQLRASQDKVNAAQQQKIYLQSLLASSNPAVDLDADGGATSSPEQVQIEKLETQLSTLQARYGAGHPDVRKTQAELNDLKARVAAEQKVELPADPPKKVVHRTVRNPVVEAEIAKLDQEIDDLTKVQPQLEEQINFHSSKLEQEPIFEERIAGLMRDYDTLRLHYNSLLDKKLSAEMATELDERQKGERFVILDTAEVPLVPAGPNRPLLILVGFLGGLLCGAGLAMVAELADQSVRNEREAAQILQKGVLAGIPFVATKRQTRRRRLLIAGALATTVICSTGLGFVISHFAERFL
jgi:polysaccharide chain length determinant protein (PEP-CTERM system associated)